MVGGGSAGLAASLTLARSLRRTLLFDGGKPRNRRGVHSHGVLGYDGTTSAESLDRGRAEFLRFGGEFFAEGVTSARRIDGGFDITTASNLRLRTRQLIIATGVVDEKPTIAGVADLWGRKVVVCPYCDGWEVRGSRIGVLGTGSRSIFQAHLLRQWSDDIVLFTNDRVAISDAEGATLDACQIQIVHGVVSSIQQNLDNSVAVGIGASERTRDVVFTAPRAIANDHLLRQLNAQSSDAPTGSFVTVDRFGATSVPGLWAIGNVVDPTLKVQAASGSGMTAGTRVNEALMQSDIAASVAAAMHGARGD